MDALARTDQAREQENSEARVAAERKTQEVDIQKLMNLPEGRRFIRRMLGEFTRLTDWHFTNDPILNALDSGKRSVGIGIVAAIETATGKDALEELYVTKKEDEHGWR